MTLQTLGVIAVATLCAGMFRIVIRYFHAAYQLRSGNAMTGRKRLPDAPVPESMAGVESSVLQLGFVPKMRMQYRLVGQPQPTVTWIYEHPEHHIELDLVETPGQPPFWAGLETRFDDGALMHTSYPRGQTIDAPQVKVNYAAYSLQDAFDFHLLTQLTWTEAHGEAMPIPKDAETLLRQAVDLNKRYGRYMYGLAIRQYVGGGIAMIGYIFIVLGIAGQLLAGNSVFSFNFLTITTLSFLVGLALAAGGNGWANRGKTPPAVDADKAPQIDPKIHPLHRPVRTI